MSKYDTVNDYITNQDKWKSDILIKLRKIITETAPEAKESIKWSQPVYEDEIGPFCFLRAHKDHVNIGFWWGSKMKDPKGLLEGDGIKMRHIKIYQDSKTDYETISDFIKEALTLNKKLGNPSR